MKLPPHIALVATLLLLTWQTIGGNVRVTALAVSNLRRGGTMLGYHEIVMLSTGIFGDFFRVEIVDWVLCQGWFSSAWVCSASYMRIYGFVKVKILPRGWCCG